MTGKEDDELQRGRQRRGGRRPRRASIQAAPTSQTGFVVRSDRGLPAAVRRITSFKQFTQQFGGYRADAFGAYARCALAFDNGGTVAYVTRVVRDGGNGAAVAASSTFTAGEDAALVVTAGVRGQPTSAPGATGWASALPPTRSSPTPTTSSSGSTAATSSGGAAHCRRRTREPGPQPGVVRQRRGARSRYITVEIPEDADANPDATDDADDADDDGFVLLTGGGDDTVAAADLPGLLAGAFERFGTFDIHSSAARRARTPPS